MRFKLLSCDVLTREVGYCLFKTPHTVDPVFTEKGEHNVPGRLRGLLQGQIDAVAAGEIPYDAVLLGYGLCGNATLGLRARRFPLVIPRAHDCTTLFLGSKEAFKEHFADNPSQTWASTGYSERGASVFSDSSTREWTGSTPDLAKLVEIYGEENAKYIFETMNVTHDSGAVWFIDVPETRCAGVYERVEALAAGEGKELRRIAGSIRLLEGLLSGDWPGNNYLVVPPDHEVEGVYDLDEVIRARPV